MCLITLRKNPIIAQEDFVVYKVLDFVDENTAAAPHYSFTYELGKTYSTRICESARWQAYDELATDAWFYLERTFTRNEIMCIGAGFHACIKSDRTNITKYEATELKRKIYKCIIPAGTEYYTDGTGLIVSNHIIIDSIHTDPVAVN